MSTDRSTVTWCWYHCILGTYGAWLPGDDRGFRTRKHREHVEGDYKNPPPPGEFGSLKETARQSLKQEPIALGQAFRECVGKALRERLEGLGAIVVAVSVSSRHVHVLAKMPFDCPRQWVGLAKKHAWYELRDRHQWNGKLWGKRGKYIPVRDREHQLRVYHYILEHAAHGAWIWKWGDD